MTNTEAWYETSYKNDGLAAQRQYPNEELIRFLSRNYQSPARILEVGCGSGANLWMIAKEGHEAHGIDFSKESLALCSMMMEKWQVSATLQQADMRSLPYPAQHFDAVVDVFSSYCLDEKGIADFLSETNRVLKPGGRFFSFTPSKESDAFINHFPASLIDGSTLDGIKRETSPFFGNCYPFRFTGSGEYAAMLQSHGLSVSASEIVSRTYRHMKETFKFVVVDAVKQIKHRALSLFAFFEPATELAIFL